MQDAVCFMIWKVFENKSREIEVFKESGVVNEAIPNALTEDFIPGRPFGCLTPDMIGFTVLGSNASNVLR